MRAQLTPEAASPPQRIILRVPAAGDFTALAEIRRDQHIQGLLLTVASSTDDEAVRGWIERRSNDRDGAFRVLAHADTGWPLGFVQITDIHHRNRCGTGGIALLPHARGKGWGRTGLELLHHLARMEKGLEKLLLYVRSDNIAALTLYSRSGYRIVGTLENHFRDHGGTLHDVLLLERKLEERT
jgi:RimJ/RimL family protein N-acetyltransferase